jgi:hypothetical protein
MWSADSEKCGSGVCGGGALWETGVVGAMGQVR